MSNQNAPYTSLGNHLKYVREQSKQSLAEVSGAVEIDQQQLERIEAGLERPTEDILLLLISYFGVQDREAVQLWEMAEYDSEAPEEIRLSGDQPSLTGKPMIMLLAMDMRTMYSDGLEVTVTPAGLTLNFSQGAGTSKPAPVARVGMSHQQAEAVIKTLQTALLHSKFGGSKRLPPPKEM
jgi:transcriptional regulator with XRE-family HTH domain